MKKIVVACLLGMLATLALAQNVNLVASTSQSSVVPNPKPTQAPTAIVSPIALGSLETQVAQYKIGRTVSYEFRGAKSSKRVPPTATFEAKDGFVLERIVTDAKKGIRILPIGKSSLLGKTITMADTRIEVVIDGGKLIPVAPLDPGEYVIRNPSNWTVPARLFGVDQK